MEKGDRKTIVISAVNLVDGGTLTILRECIRYLSENLADKYEIIALVNRKGLIPFEHIEYLDFPKSKESWLNRLYYEYYYFYKLSKRLNPFLWLSLHDITPKVTAERQAVYCHNPSPFYKISFRNLLLEPRFFLFNLFYEYLYSINIHRNDYVIVQQNWIRKEFINRFSVQNVVVAHPHAIENIDTTHQAKLDKYTFIYPAFPRIFKNFEVICEAAERLYLKGLSNFEIILTIDGSETKYSNSIYKKYKSIPILKFIGLQPINKIYQYYSVVDCLIFPSKLETWGMPITEFKRYGKPILVADLPYSHETVGNYSQVKFFAPDNVGDLADAIEALMSGDLRFDTTSVGNIEHPYAENWEQLFNILLS
jgi:glycosyltransferase involved in cell wall biosynthesis